MTDTTIAMEDLFPDDDFPPEAPVETPGRRSSRKVPFRKRLLAFILKFVIFLLTTVILAAIALYGVMYVLVKGPSPSARDLFVLSVRETSAVGFLANLFLTDEEIAAIDPDTVEEEVADFVESDPSLIQIPQPTDPADENTGPQPDAWGLIDEDGDGIIIEDVRGQGYAGKMMIVLDPSRVIMGSVPKSYGSRGYTVTKMVELFDGVAGINAGGFEDPNGQGNGSIPDTLVVYEGEVYYANKGIRNGFVGLDSNNILHVATRISTKEIKEKDIQYGVCFGPVLVTNGEECDFSKLVSGVNPRTAIGQRADGAILMLVIDGRQVSSLGATYADLAEIFLAYGAVNACNLDGGSSSVMFFEDGYINNCASVVGIRPVPTTFIVLKEGGNGDD